MYFAIISSVTLPELRQKYPLAHKASAQELPLQARRVRQQMAGGLPIQPLRQAADRHLRRNRYEQVHVIIGYVALHDPYFVLPADFAD